MIEVEQETLAAVQKPEPENVVMNKSQLRPQHNVHQAEAATALYNSNLRSGRRIAVHVVNVATEGRVGIVDERMLESTGGPGYFKGGMRAVFLELARATPDQAQLAIRIKAAVLNPTA